MISCLDVLLKIGVFVEDKIIVSGTAVGTVATVVDGPWINLRMPLKPIVYCPSFTKTTSLFLRAHVRKNVFLYSYKNCTTLKKKRHDKIRWHISTNKSFDSNFNHSVLPPEIQKL